MKILKTILITIPSALLYLVEPALSQAGPPEICRSPNSTAIDVAMANGTQLRFSIERDGNKVRGTANYDGGRGTLNGEFSGQYVFWEVLWEDGSQAVFSGQFSKGDGSGTAFHSSNKESRINWSARTAAGCPRWADEVLPKPAQQPQDECTRLGLPKVGDKCGCPSGLTQDITGRCVATAPAQKPQEAAKPTEQAKCSGGRVGAPPKCQCPAGKQWSGQSCIVQVARRASGPKECPHGTTRAASGACVQAVQSGLPIIGIGIPSLIGGALIQLRGGAHRDNGQK
jgi:hypothetical protein